MWTLLLGGKIHFLTIIALWHYLAKEKVFLSNLLFYFPSFCQIYTGSNVCSAIYFLSFGSVTYWWDGNVNLPALQDCCVS